MLSPVSLPVTHCPPSSRPVPSVPRSGSPEQGEEPDPATAPHPLQGVRDSLTFAAPATAKQQARPTTASSRRPMLSACLWWPSLCVRVIWSWGQGRIHTRAPTREQTQTHMQGQMRGRPSFPEKAAPGAHSAPVQVSAYLGAEAGGTGRGTGRAGTWLCAGCLCQAHLPGPGPPSEYRQALSPSPHCSPAQQGESMGTSVGLLVETAVCSGHQPG